MPSDVMLFNEVVSASCAGGFFPDDPFEVEDEDGVNDRDEAQGDDRGQCETTDLGVAEWLPSQQMDSKG
jgi:hypothetical protein